MVKRGEIREGKTLVALLLEQRRSVAGRRVDTDRAGIAGVWGARSPQIKESWEKP